MESVCMRILETSLLFRVSVYNCSAALVEVHCTELTPELIHKASK